MAKGISYAFAPRIPTVPMGTLLRTKIEIQGTNAVGIHEDDEDLEYGGDLIIVPENTTCMLAEEHQFMGVDKQTPMSAWVRWRLIAGDKIIYYSVVCERKRIWDFKTFRGKQRIIQEGIDKAFEILQKGSGNQK